MAWGRSPTAGSRASREEVTTMSGAPSPGSAAEALGMLRSAMGYLAAADATQMAAETQAKCLLALEQLDAIETAARASILAAFTSAQGYSADADYSPRAWLINKTQGRGERALGLGPPGRGASAGGRGAGRGAHPVGVGGPEDLPVDGQTARGLPPGRGRDPDRGGEVRCGPARPGGTGPEIYARSPRDEPDSDPDGEFNDRSLKLETTFQGAGVLNGDLTPECGAVVTAVLDALSAPAGATTPGPTSSGITMRFRRRCAAWWPPGCSRSGPGSQ